MTDLPWPTLPPPRQDMHEDARLYHDKAAAFQSLHREEWRKVEQLERKLLIARVIIGVLASITIFETITDRIAKLL